MQGKYSQMQVLSAASAVFLTLTVKYNNITNNAYFYT